MKKILLLMLFILTLQASAQTVFTLQDFSKDYYARVEVADTSQVFSKGWVAVYDNKTHKQIIKVKAGELALELHNGMVQANIRMLPYGEQSVLIYDDFNFDGKKDFAICDGQKSGYHSPSYNIYLAGASGFFYSAAFSRLSHEYLGMFDVDAKEKKLYTMSKDGCCWHENSVFVVKNNQPKVISIVTEDETTPFPVLTEQNWNGKAMVKKSAKALDLHQEGVQLILSFDIPAKQKKVVLVDLNGRMLYYAVLRKDSTVEFSYPVKQVYQAPDFKFNPTVNNLSVSFKNGGANYRVYEHKDSIGVDITTGGKTYHWDGDIKTRKNTLSKLQEVKLDNVYAEVTTR